MQRILIIEDDSVTRLGAELVLSALGFHVETAVNGREGLERMRAMIPDIVVCDVLMPEMDGFEVLEKAQGEARLARIPFIFLSSLDDREAQRKGMALGADDFLVKPFQPSELVDAIQVRLKKHALLSEAPPDLDAALARIRALLGGCCDGRAEQMFADAGLFQKNGAERSGSGPASGLFQPEAALRREHWIRKIRAYFDESRVDGLLYAQDELQSKKMLIHATYLLAVLYVKVGRKEEARAEWSVAQSVLRLNAERMRNALHEAVDPGVVNRYRLIRSKGLRLERKLSELSKLWP